MAPSKAERRVDPEDGCEYTFEELAAFYEGKYKKGVIQAYWDSECTPAKAKAKAKAKAEGKAKAKAKAKPKAKAEGEKKEKPQLRIPASAEEVLRRVTECKVVPVIKVDEVAHAVPLGKALRDGSVDVLEITFRTPCAAEAISEVCKGVDGVCVGAGTVLSPGQVDVAVDGGADFIVSPGFDPAVARRCRARKVLYLPGVITPTEVMMVTSRFQLKALKFFPASNFGGAGTLKSYSAVFPGISFMPTGGVTEDNIGSFVGLPNVIAAGGSWFVSDPLVKKAAASGDWSEVTAAAQKASKAAKAEK